ncbi:MAG: ABC-ATPase UvrA [Pseudobdellovibrionaceae bacterium]
MASNHDFDGVVVKGAKEHNLKDVSVVIPRNKITVFTGLSGSGKSSLAFDTVYAEGQRRYVESLSAYARNFLEQLKKPEVDSVTGLSPAIAIDQKSVSTNPRSTVGTVTEIYDYLRLLFAKVGVPECPIHHLPVSSQTPQQILEEMIKKASKNPQAAKLYILAPMAQGKKGEFMAEFQRWARKGFVKAQIDGKFIDLEKATKLAKTKVHDIDLVVDQVILKEPHNRLRLAESINTALSMANGRLVTQTLNGERVSYSLHSACPECGYSFPEIEPRIFSFNNPRGACLSCHGLGTADLVEEEEFSDGVVGARRLEKVKYTYKGKKVSTSNEEEDEEESEEMVFSACPECQGARLKKESLNVRIQGKNIAELADLSAVELRDWIAKISWKTKDQLIAEKIVKQIVNRLDYLIRVGTGYLSLSRPSRTLSGGEAQRIRLATQVGSSLIGVLYVMDEPSIGLHPRDHHRLLNIIAELKDRGNTILLVEHDEDTIRFADHVVDLGPRAGRLGGEMMAAGTPQEIEANPKSLTGRYLSGELRIPIPTQRRQGHGQKLRLIGATGNNLKNVTLEIPLGTFTAVTGVSGSGKSTLIIDTLFKILAQRFYKASATPSSFQKLEGIEHIDKVIDINQRPIGRTPRSTPATYVGLFPMIRDLFANLPDSKLRGYSPGRFSFNVKGGRCETCMGHGQIRVEMHFMSDVFVKCETCLGARYNRETLNVKFKGKSISDILNLTVLEALEIFKNHPQIRGVKASLYEAGAVYASMSGSGASVFGIFSEKIALPELEKGNLVFY